MKELVLQEIHSGGQYGADLTGLEVAKALGLKTGGIAPKGWRVCNPDGTNGTNPSLAEYGLTEHWSSDYPPRTILNVGSTDGTVVFGYLKSPGAKLTIDAAQAAGKHLITNPDAIALRDWLIKHQIRVLNVAGNRLSDHNPGIVEQVRTTLTEALTGSNYTQLALL